VSKIVVMNNALIYFLLVKIIVVSSGITLAQDFILDKPDTSEWNEGTISLDDGTTITGLLKLNTRTGLLAYENGSLTPNKVLGFEFFDRIQNKKRSYISVNYEYSGSSGGAKTRREGASKFFEILMEFKAFALLSSFEKLELRTRSSPPTGGGYNPITNTVQHGHAVNTTTGTVYSQTETLFIFDPDGIITPLLEVINTEKDFASIIDLPRTKAKSRKLDNEIIEKHTSPHFKTIEDFANENNLNFKRKDDLLMILEYYKQIESN